MKIFLTGDNHIGMKYANHAAAERLVSERIDAFDRMVEKANAESCALFVVAGDRFDKTAQFQKGQMRKVIASLSAFDGMVVVLPGNHDYYGEDVKVWQDFSQEIQDRDNIVLLREYAPYEMDLQDERVTLYPAFCTAKCSDSAENNLGWIKALSIPAEDAWHIGIAHGALEGLTIDRESQYFCMNRDELEAIPMDVWLLGHTHVPYPNNLTETFAEAGRIFNAGTHVQTDVNCNTEGLCFILSLERSARGKTVLVKKWRSGGIRFFRQSVSLEPGRMEEILTRSVNNYSDESVVDVVLTGTVSREEYAQRTEIIMRVLSRFLESTYTDAALAPEISREMIADCYPETSFSAALLRRFLDEGEKKEAQMVFDLLQDIEKEGRK